MKELNKRLSSGSIDKVYVFYGNETYLIRHYEKRLAEAVFGNETLADAGTTVFDQAVKAADIIAAAETPSFLSNRRLVIVRDSGLLQAGRKDEAEKLAEYIAQMPEGPVLLFLETAKAPDKRLKLYKKAAEAGLAVEFSTPSEPELINWLTKMFKAGGLEMPAYVARGMLRQIGSWSESLMDLLYTEAQKLMSYVLGRGSASVSADDVASVCVQSVEGKIFGLVGEIGQKNINALGTFGNLIAMKEQPLGVLSMITRQFRLMLICNGLRGRGMSNRDIAQTTGLRDFMVTDFLAQSKNFTEDTLINAMEDCLEAESSVKTGKMSDRLAVEMLIVKYCTL